MRATLIFKGIRSSHYGSNPRPLPMTRHDGLVLLAVEPHDSSGAIASLKNLADLLLGTTLNSEANFRGESSGSYSC